MEMEAMLLELSIKPKILNPFEANTKRKRAFSNQSVFYYMSSLTLLQLQNNIYLQKFHVDRMAFQMS
jgi:hypothetical protein